MKKLLNTLLMVTIGLFALPNTAAAYDGIYTGTIQVLQFNSDVVGRGVCVGMNPDVGWVCLPTSNALYKEITAILLTAYATGKSCTLYVQFAGAPLNNEIKVAQCQ